jgi:hypothetical protein
MAHYLVRVTPRTDALPDLRARLDDAALLDMEPFGRAVTESLENARYDPEHDEAVWEEEDYCSPPLTMEREAVLDDYFEDISIEAVSAGAGWKQIEDLPSLWERA